MTTSLLRDAFSHHTWATRCLLDACSELSAEQLEAGADGVYGSIIDTLRHLVGADASYLVAVAGREPPPDADWDVNDMREMTLAHGAEWLALLDRDLDPEAVVVRHRDDGSESHAPLGIRLAQALHHGTDHRSQICTILTTLSIEPPAIDVWDFAEFEGRLHETPATR